MKRLFKKKVARNSATAGLDASTGVPDSGFAFVNNAQGASAAIVELSRALDDVLNELEFEAEASDFANLQLQRLDDEASKYINSRLAVDQKQQQWSCRSVEGALLLAAAKCSAAIYQPMNPTILTNDSYAYRQLQYIEPSKSGTVKGTAFYEARSASPQGSRSDHLLIIAVRGSASKVDHMVNLNNQAVDIGNFIKHTSSDEDLRPQAHAGFLNGARYLEPTIRKHLGDLGGDGGPKEVIFTGHSAGAAVATLLFEHFLSPAESDFPNVAFNCITFGSPPLGNPAFSKLSKQVRRQAKNSGLHVNFINEFDLVPRLDRPYIIALIDLYKSRYPRLSKPEESTSDILISSDDRLSTPTQSTMDWPLPQPDLRHAGDIVLLSLAEMTFEGASPLLQATVIDSDILGMLLFCRLTAHKMAVYLANIEELFAQTARVLKKN